MLISIVIITYNRSKELAELLINLHKQSYKSKQIIVVDNNSTDNTETIIQNFRDVNYYKIDRNLGVPGGRNFGIKKATGNIILFIDNDAEIMDGGLDLIINAFKKNATLGILAPRIDNFFSKELDRSSWVYSVHKLKDKDKSFFTFFFVGCAFAVRKEVFENCGLLWDDLFFMHEEKDFAHRVVAADFSIKYEPAVRVYHKVSQENRYTISSRFFEYGSRNIIWIFMRYYPFHIFLYKTTIFLFLQSIQAIKTGNLRAHILSVIEAIKHIKIPLSKRKKLDYASRKKIKELQYVKKDAFNRRVKRVFSNTPYTE